MDILITGTAGFIGFHLAQRMLSEGHRVLGLDGLTDYYDVALKRRRHAILGERAQFEPMIERLENRERVAEIVAGFEPEIAEPAKPVSDPSGGIKGRRKSKKDKLREAAALAATGGKSE